MAVRLLYLSQEDLHPIETSRAALKADLAQPLLSSSLIPFSFQKSLIARHAWHIRSIQWPRDMSIVVILTRSTRSKKPLILPLSCMSISNHRYWFLILGQTLGNIQNLDLNSCVSLSSAFTENVECRRHMSYHIIQPLDIEIDSRGLGRLSKPQSILRCLTDHPLRITRRPHHPTICLVSLSSQAWLRSKEISVSMLCWTSLRHVTFATDIMALSKTLRWSIICKARSAGNVSSMSECTKCNKVNRCPGGNVEKWSTPRRKKQSINASNRGRRKGEEGQFLQMKNKKSARKAY